MGKRPIYRTLATPHPLPARYLGNLDPRAIAGLSLYLRSDLGVSLTGGVVSTWADQSGTANHATQATAGQRPSLVASVQHRQPAIRCNGSTFLSLASEFLGTQWTAFVVFSVVSATATAALLDSRNTATGAANSVLYAGTFRYAQASAADGTHGVSVVASGSLSAATAYLAIASSAAGTPITVAINADTPSSSSNAISGFTANAWSIGTEAFLGSTLQGDLFAILVYNRVLSDAESAVIRGALAPFYALF